MISLYNIPTNDITIRPRILIKELNKIFKTLKDDFRYKKEEYMRTLNIIIRELKYNINKSYFWYLISSETICSHIFTTNSKKFGMMCAKRVDINCKQDKYKCAEHVNNNYISKKRNKDGKILCKDLNKKQEPCELEGKYDGMCIYHFKIYNKIDTIKNAHNIYKKNKIKYDTEYNLHKEETEPKNIINEKIIKKTPKIDITNYIHEIINKSVNIDDLYQIIKKNNKPNISNNMLNFNESFQSISKYIKQINKENIEYKYQEKIDDEIMSSWNVSSLDEVNNIINKYRTLCKIYPNDVEQDLYDINETISYIDNIIHENNKQKEDIIDSLNNKYNELNIQNDKKIIDINYKVITKIINNNTYINISYLEEKLNNYNNKFKEFKQEIEDDFPNIYNKIKGYFEIQQDIFNTDIERNIEFSKIISEFL